MTTTSETMGSGARKMDRRRYEFVLEAATPIAHHAEVMGNEALAFRRKIRQRDGWAYVPIVTADTMRHGMREAAAYALLDAAGMLDAPSLSDGALRLLFAGGMVTGKGDGSVIKLDAYRELCELVPSMSLFGGCCDNRVTPGRLIVEDATLVCAETSGFVPAWSVAFAREHAGELDSCRAHVEEEQRVRMDPTLVPQKVLMMSADAKVALNHRLAAGERAHADGDAVEADRSKSTMMPRRFERVAQGSLFSWACEATCYSELDVDTFHVAAASFLARAWVGGKRGTGHGLLRPIASNAVAIARPAVDLAPIDALAPMSRAGDLFRAHVVERKSRIRDFFAGVNA